MATWVEQIAEIVQEIILRLHYPGIALVMFGVNVIPPIPSEAVMPFAGFLAADGTLTFFGILIAGTIGVISGALTFYYLGTRLHENAIRRLVRRYGKFLLISESDFDYSLRFFNKHGGVVVFLGDLIPLVRSLISLPAGLNRMALPKFLLYTTCGALLWNGILAGAGWWLGSNWEIILQWIDRYEIVLIVVGALAAGYFLVRRFRERKKS
jgi:membrane protein DedA with SNARE-associated domain